jgi:uncharacterized membrane protein YjfL (UPF0719 family)
MVTELLTAMVYGVAYVTLGVGLLAAGAAVLDWITPGSLVKHVFEGKSMNAALAMAGGFFGLAAVVFTAIWTNGDSSFGAALAWTAGFGTLGIALQAAAFWFLDVLTPGKLGEEVMREGALTPAGLVAFASQVSVAAIIVASIA